LVQIAWFGKIAFNTEGINGTSREARTIFGLAPFLARIIFGSGGIANATTKFGRITNAPKVQGKISN